MIFCYLKDLRLLLLPSGYSPKSDICTQIDSSERRLRPPSLIIPSLDAIRAIHISSPS